MGWFPTLAGRAAVGEHADLYPRFLSQVPHVIRALSLVPDNVGMLRVLSAAQYVPVERVARVGGDTGRALSRAQMELVAGRVSALNEFQPLFRRALRRMAAR